MNYAVWRAEKGVGTLEVALFPRPLVTSKDVTLKTMLSDLVARGVSQGNRGKVSRCFVSDSHMGSHM